MKTQINNLKDYAELAWASYFYFDFLNTRNCKGYFKKEHVTILNNFSKNPK